jgi:hypothetical protein
MTKTFFSSFALSSVATNLAKTSLNGPTSL